MTSDRQTCDETKIQQFLNEQLSLEEQTVFEDHLSSCPSCREHLQQVAATPDIWTSAKELLVPTFQDRIVFNGDSAQEQSARPSSTSLLESLLPSDDPEMLGRIGDYEIMGVVGTGGMGAVFKGFDKSLRRVVAIKVMARHLADSGSARQRFQREARAAAAITHDNVIDIYAVSEVSGLPYLVMPYARGPSLQKRIDDGGPLMTIQVARIGRQIAYGLAAAHDQGLVHRDIKPANILLHDGIERLWITDFGVARAMDDVSMTQTGVIAGTPLFMSPEQARGEDVDHRSDLFSLGSVLYAVCTGRPPFRSDSAYGILRRITDTDPRPIQDLNPDIPEWLCRIVSRLMAKHPADRFETADEVSVIFEDCVAHLQQPQAMPLPECLTTPNYLSPSDPSSALGGSNSLPERRPRLQRTGVWLMTALLSLFALGLTAFQLTQPSNIAGDWSGETWNSISVQSADEADGWYTGAFADEDGERGVLQLEWSRLKQRYVGRWRIGKDDSGSVTLRTSANGMIRGAISVDADSKLDSNDLRLRDFVWTRTDRKGQSVDAQVDKGADAVQTVTSPVNGVIVKTAPELANGSRIHQGEFIALITPNSNESHANLQSAITASQQQIEFALTNLEIQRQKETAARSKVLAAENHLVNMEKSERAVAQSLTAGGNAAAERLEGKKQEVAALEAALAEATKQQDVAKTVQKQGIVSNEEVRTKAANQKELEAKVAKAKSAVREAESELIEKQNLLTARKTGSEKLDPLKVKLAHAKSELAQVSGEIAQAELQLKQAEQDLAQLKQKSARVERFEIRSPIDGIILSLISPNGNETIKVGDSICAIKAASSRLIENPSVDVDEANAATPASPETSPANAQDEMNVTRTFDSFGTVSDLAKRFRASKLSLRSSNQRLADSKQKLALAEKELFDLKTKLKVLERNVPSSVADSTARKAESVMEAQIKAAELKIASQRQAIISQQDTIGYARGSLEEAEKEKQTIIRLLKVRIDSQQQKLEYNSDLAKRYRHAFESGKITAIELIPVEHEIRIAKSQLDELNILLKHYEGVGR